MQIKGTIASVRYSKENFSIITLEDDDRHEKGALIACKGSIVNPVPGVKLILEGDWLEDPKWGLQFNVRSSRMDAEMSREGMIAYLSSGYIKGVGEKTAELIVDKFGKETMSVIEFEPERLVEIPRITGEKAKTISEMFKATRVYMDIYDLFGNNITDFQVRAIYDRYGPLSVKKIQENPYQLIHDIDGFGFKRVDAIALSYGIPKDSPKRIGAAISFFLQENSVKGHCYSTVLAVEAGMEELLGMAVDSSLLASVLKKEINEGHFVYEMDGDRLYLPAIYSAEVYCGEQVFRMLNQLPPRTTDDCCISSAISAAEAAYGFELEEQQKRAVIQALKNRLCVITGGPGTGKTTIVRAILKAYTGKVFLVAPTGKASRRMSEVSSGAKATTIHRLLMDFQANPDDYEDVRGLIIADEASMLDIHLAAKLLKFAEKTDSSLVLLGDIDQLPPIGPGSFFMDLVRSPVIPVIRLQLSHRQQGKIAINAKKINSGEGPHALLEDDKFRWVKIGGDGDAQEKVLEEYYALVEEYGVENVCCLCPMRKDTSKKTDGPSKRVVSDTLNKIIRDKLNPPDPTQLTIKGCGWRLHDRVMQTQNNYRMGVFNGDCGTIVEIDVFDKLIYVMMDDGRRVAYSVPDSQQLVLAYAMTIHKSQGSEYKAVVVAQCKEHYIMLQRNLLYTGVTRAREKVVLVGDTRSISIAVGNVPAMQRNTLLKLRIRRSASGRR